MNWFGVLVLLLALTPALPAQNNHSSDIQVGDFRFPLPPGWTRVDRDNKNLLVPANTVANPSTYIQFNGFDLGSNDLQAGFNAGWQGFAQGHKVVSDGPVVSRHSPSGFNYLYTTGTTTEGGKQWDVAFAGAQYGKRLETVLFVSSDPDPQTRKAYLKQFQSFLDSIRFAPSGTSTASLTGNPRQAMNAIGPGRLKPSCSPGLNYLTTTSSVASVQERRGLTMPGLAATWKLHLVESKRWEPPTRCETKGQA
jgi:hypothetical protein